MKKLSILFTILLPVLCKAQERLYLTPIQIKALYPEQRFYTSVSLHGEKFITTYDMPYGTFAYYFEKNMDKCIHCLQIPRDLKSMNKQIEIYNKSYQRLPCKPSEIKWINTDNNYAIEITLYKGDSNNYMFSYEPLE